MGYSTTALPLDAFADEAKTDGDQWMADQFGDQETQHIKNNESLHVALHYFYAYVRKNQSEALSQFNAITFYKSDDYLLLDAATQRNLELVGNSADGGRKNTLFGVMDDAMTPMGSRLIKKWIQRRWSTSRQSDIDSRWLARSARMLRCKRRCVMCSHSWVMWSGWSVG